LLCFITHAHPTSSYEVTLCVICDVWEIRGVAFVSCNIVNVLDRCGPYNFSEMLLQTRNITFHQWINVISN
jgi:hypothetical protein